LSGEANAPTLTVREMRLADVGMRIDYFHDASDRYLDTLGVDRSRLPSREEWYAFYEEDYARPIHLRTNYSLVWELDGQPVGFGSTDQITFGEEARMHLHIVRPTRRREGLGHQFVRQSVPVYFEVLRPPSTWPPTAPCSVWGSGTSSPTRRHPGPSTTRRPPPGGCCNAPRCWDSRRLAGERGRRRAARDDSHPRRMWWPRPTTCAPPCPLLPTDPSIGTCRPAARP